MLGVFGGSSISSLEMLPQLGKSIPAIAIVAKNFLPGIAILSHSIFINFRFNFYTRLLVSFRSIVNIYVNYALG